MTLQEFYAKIGGNSADVLRRLPSEAMVRKFIGKYPADTSWGSLESAINSQDWEAAFRAAVWPRTWASRSCISPARPSPRPCAAPSL